MKTVTIVLSNAGSLLDQNEWAHVIYSVRNAIRSTVNNIRFEGSSDYDAPWQRVCWVCETSDSLFPSFLTTINSPSLRRAAKLTVIVTDGCGDF